MKNGKPEHYWRIHARVARRILTDTPERIRHVIANDSEHTTQEYQWFAKKVEEDTARLYLDPNYYDQEVYTWRHSR